MKYILLYSFSIITFICQSQVGIHLTSIPEPTPDSANLFLAGSINGWSPNDSKYQLEIKEGDYWLNMSGSEKMEFKITCGSWEKVQSNKYVG